MSIELPEPGAHLSADDIDGYRRGIARLRVEAHLAACAACRTLAFVKTRRSFAAMGSGLLATPDDHPEFDEVSGFVDGTLDETARDAIEAHVTSCALCAAEIADLQDLRTEIAGARRALDADATMQAPGRRRAWPSRRLALAAAAVLLAAIAWLLIQSARPAVPPQQARGDAGIATPSRPAAPPAAASPAAGPAMVDGALRVDADGSVTGLEPLDSESRALVTRALSGNAPVAASLAHLRSAGDPLMGGRGRQSGFGPLTPLSIVVESDRPIFQWTPAPGATEYRVSVVDARLTPVARSEAVRGTEWRPAAPLPRGAVYSWQIDAVSAAGVVSAPTPPAPEARFRVLDRPAHTRLEQARQTLGGSHLVMGILMSRAGLLDEAERELEALVSANPQSPVAARLLADVRRARP